jgi:acid phosphatase type 7
LQVAGSYKTYSVDQMCGLNAAIYYLNPGNVFSAVMNNLKPNSLIFYKVVSKFGSSSEIFSFKTAPVPGPDNSISMFAFGDSGVSKCQNMTGWCELPAGQTYANIESDMRANSNFSLLLHIGDISYAVGHANRWEQFFYEIKPMATQLPYVRRLAKFLDFTPSEINFLLSIFIDGLHRKS